MIKDFSDQRDKKISIKEKNKTHLVVLNEIAYLRCDSYLTTVYMIGLEKITVSKLLKDFEIELSANGFIRANRNTIVNVRNIVCFQNGKKNCIGLINGDEIKVSARRLKYVKNIFES